tara:strand:+ start:5106 stop:5543 length:438 start_codon:yes stop_codon:yes gene_type:complete
MRSKASKHLPYKICMDVEKHIQLDNAIKTFNNIISLDLYSNEIYKRTVREIYSDYTNYVKNRISDKLFINGLYYTLLAENIDNYYKDTSNTITTEENADLEVIYKSALWYFKDSLLIKKKDPQAKFYVAQLNKYLLDNYSYDDEL